MTQVVVTGATGNVGLAVVRALAADTTVDSVVGVARRRPSLTVDKVTWEAADVGVDDLSARFAGADVVIHLAWLIQPSRQETETWKTNVGGTTRVLDAVAAASVPAVVIASSVGAYSPGPKDHAVDETWPTDGVPTSSYSRQKAYVERLLDIFEGRHPDIRVARLRTALVFQAQAGTEIRRYFGGPFLPSWLLTPGHLPVFPRIPGISTQVVHADDAAEAYRLAATAPVRGPFNVAAEPALDMDEMARILGARSVPVPSRVARALAEVTWRARLQPTDPGWLDLALAVPLMDINRARRDLGWTPRWSAQDAFHDVAQGAGGGQGASTPPLLPDRIRRRLHEIRTGVGGR